MTLTTGRNTYSISKVYISGKEIPEFSAITLNVPGNNEINSLRLTINDPYYQNAHLFNSKVEFYINEGGAQGTPTFVGYIKEVSPSDTSIMITAYDPRILISGQDAEPVAITDRNNYDGHTVVQFLVDVISSNINTASETKIDLSALADFAPAISMTGYRTNGKSPYDVFLEVIGGKVDDENPEDPLPFFVDILGNKLIVGKRKRLMPGDPKEEQLPSGSRAYNLSYNDGLMSLRYTNVNPPTRAVALGKGGGWGEFQYGNVAAGVSGRTITGDKENNAELSDLARIEVMKDYNETKEIKAVVSRGYHIGLENIVFLSVPDRVLRGKHRVTSKRISVDRSGVHCTLGLDKREPRTGDFVERKIISRRTPGDPTK